MVPTFFLVGHNNDKRLLRVIPTIFLQNLNLGIAIDLADFFMCELM